MLQPPEPQPADVRGGTGAEGPPTPAAGTPASTRTSAPTPTLPKGGGAIRGIGEKFGANPVTGTGSMTVPIATSPGRSGFGPELALSYDSGAGNGPFSFGWQLSIPSITRKTDKGLPRYQDADESDVFVLAGAEDLVPVLRADGTRFEDSDTVPGYTIHRYRPRVEGLFARIERWTTNDGDVHWRSLSRENVLTVYGKDENSRIADSADPTRVFSWLICERRDDKGNAVVYTYKPEDGTGADLTRVHERNRGPSDDPRRAVNRYPKRIRYGNRTPLLDDEGRRPRALSPADVEGAGWMFEVVFDYGEHDADAPAPGDAGAWAYRDDPFSTYRAGFEVRTTRLCRRVLMFHHFEHEAGVGNDCLVRSTDLTYSAPEDPAAAQRPVYTFLQSVTQSGYRRQDGGYLKRSLPPLEFEYTEPVASDEARDVDPASLENLPAGVDGSLYQWTDLHGEGIAGILAEQADAWFYKRNISPISERDVELEPTTRVEAKPNLVLAGGRAQFMDLAGDGQPDLVVLDGLEPGLYEHDDDEGWLPFRPFASQLNRTMRDANLKLVDLDGDGRADVLISEDDAFVWHPSLGEDGFAPALRVPHATDEERAPALVFADETQSVYLADLSGDGLGDLARIRNGEVCYWPNLGYGRFGAKVTMDNSPYFDEPDQFDHARIRLVDIDGSGTSDLVYLHRDGVRLYFNQSGNVWSAPQELGLFPDVDDVVAVTPTDLLGNGTACLVWSSPLPGDAGRQLRYVDLMGGQKPHLLVKTANNLGAETHVTYSTSAKFYLQDRRDGRPWITRLPFPVHVVERVETYDRISRNRFVTRYAYHHGYFDGEEREFRGFGMVEQWDTEEMAALAESDVFPVGDNVDAASHVPPVHTRSWFHTGLYVGRDHVSDYFAGFLGTGDPGEYYREPGLTDDEARALLLPDTVLPDGLSLDEEREACRALKGSMLRQEVYAIDGAEEQDHPFAVTEQNFTIGVLQRQGPNRHGVFFAHARESLTYHYDREPTDPRIGHTLTLAADDFGNVLKSAAIGYGRRQPDLSLPNADQAKQTQILVTYTENRFTTIVESVGDHRLPLPYETSTYELTGFTPSAESVLFTFDEVVAAGMTALPLDYEESPTPGRREKRLIEQLRTYYRRDDLAGALPLGQMQSLGLPFESCKLAFTPGLIAKVYGARVGDAMLRTEGGYVHSEGDDNWWIPSGRIFYSPDPAHTPPQELTYAREHFFLPHRYRDPFHTDAVSTESFVTYDLYDLLVQETRDALGNRVTAGERNLDPTQPAVRFGQDYRVLQPELVMDPNRNRSEVVFDALGMVVGTAVMGKPEDDPVPGDGLGTTFQADLTQAQIDQFVAAPTGPTASTLLGDATTRIVYDLTAYSREPDPTKKPPAVTATLARETHASEPVPAGGLRIQVSFSYSDGFGREIQKKIPAEPGPVPVRDAGGKIVVGADGQPQPTPNDVSPRWVGSGWTVFNNKGKPVRQYEPFFTDTHRFEFDVKIGFSPTLLYDPVERVVGTLHPNHTWEKVVFDPWRQETWDSNDTVAIADPTADADIGNSFSRLAVADYVPTWNALRTDPANAAAFSTRYPDPTVRTNETQAAEKAQVHAGTFTVAHADSLGRTFLTIAHNKFKYSDTPPSAPPVEEFYSTRITLDIEGNQREVADAMGRVVMRYEYDMLGNRVHQASMDAGERWMLGDAAGKPLYLWDGRDHRFRSAYDPLRRLTASFLRQGAGAEMLVARTSYGESRPNAEAANVRGKVVELCDQAGVVSSDEYDFKGNLLHNQRRLTQSYKTTVDWSGAVPLEPETYTSRTRYDALNRPTQLIAPHSDRPGTTINVIQPSYNEANLLERLHAWLDQNAEPVARLDPATANLQAITNIDYDAKGQRTLVDYGNGTRTTYTYDPSTFRLTHLLTRRNATAFPSDCPTPPPAEWPGCQVQNLHYSYDPVGNITHIRDDAQQTIYFRNKRVEPTAEYTYDALYRLIEATGREHLGQVGGQPTPHSYNDAPRAGLLHPGDGNAMGRYIERYVYDAVGNFLSMRHRGTDPANTGWNRSYAYDEPSVLEPGKQSNRLTSSTVGGTTETYSTAGDGYDAAGSMLRMPHLQVMQWDFKDQLQMTQRQAVSAADADGVQHQGERTWYVYDSTGQRVRKVTELAVGQVKGERLYLGGFEIYRRNGPNELVRETLHIMDDKKLIALVDRRTTGDEPGVPQQLIRYQLGNHLGSVCLVLDDQAQVVSYEEYTPYGSSSYQAGRSQTETPRYRYTGRERDDETGLSYHLTRYFAPWLGRWPSPDFKGTIDGLCAYCYCRCNPIALRDVSGTEGRPPLPGMIANDPRVGALWERAVVETLGPRFHSRTYGDVVRAFQNEVAGRIAARGGALGSNRARGTAINYARSAYQAVRTRFGQLAARSGISLEGLQIHHMMSELAHAPHEALTTTNLMFARGNAATVGSGHNFAHQVGDAHAAGIRNPGQHVATRMHAEGIRPDVPELSATIHAPSAAPHAPTTVHAPVPHGGAGAAAETGRVGTALARERAVLGTAGRAIEETAPTLARVARTGARGGARVLGAVGRVAGPLAIAESSYRLGTATNNLDRLQAGADTAAGVAAYAGPVGEAFAVGYGAGQLLDAGVEMATGESLSSRGARGMTAVDQTISRMLPQNNSLPQYKQENRIAWWLIDTFNL